MTVSRQETELAQEGPCKVSDFQFMTNGMPRFSQGVPMEPDSGCHGRPFSLQRDFLVRSMSVREATLFSVCELDVLLRSVPEIQQPSAQFQ